MNDTHRSGDERADKRAARAADYARATDFEAAADLMHQALDLAPDWTAGWTVLGTYRMEAGDADGAATAFERALALDPADGFGAGLRLAALGRRPAPAAAPRAFVRGLFDQYAGRFETSLVDDLAYVGPDRLMEALLCVAGTTPRWRTALDVGCGTGLMGERLRPFCERLEGVDLSPDMMARARRKGLYDALDEADIAMLDRGTRTYDLVMAADVFNYVGDPAPVVARVAALLEPGGAFALTLEAFDGPEPYRLGQTLRYAHFAPAVTSLLEKEGLVLRHRGEIVLRRDRGLPVAAHVLVALRPD